MEELILKKLQLISPEIAELIAYNINSLKELLMNMDPVHKPGDIVKEKNPISSKIRKDLREISGFSSRLF